MNVEGKTQTVNILYQRNYMAYFYEKTIKDQLMIDIEELMNATDTHIVGDSMEDMAYEDLIECKNSLIKEYIAQQNITEFQFNYPKE